MLPKNYELPASEVKTDGYLNAFEVGDTKIRVLTPIQTGFEWHVGEDGKGVIDRKFIKGDRPVRVRTFQELVNQPEATEYRHFWVMVIWNYEKELIQILQIKQTSIQKQIAGYEKDEDWGDCQKYDLVINRVGKGLDDTKYQVIAKPAKPVTEEIKRAFLETPIDLDAWFRSENPFKKKDDISEQEVEDINDSIPF